MNGWAYLLFAHVRAGQRFDVVRDADDGAAPFQQQYVSPAAIHLAQSLASTDDAKTTALVQSKAYAVLREDPRLQCPDAGTLGGSDERLHQARADPLAALV